MKHNLTWRAAACLAWLGLGTLMAADLTRPLDPAMPGREFEGIGAVSAGASACWHGGIPARPGFTSPRPRRRVTASGFLATAAGSGIAFQRLVAQMPEFLSSQFMTARKKFLAWPGGLGKVPDSDLH